MNRTTFKLNKHTFISLLMLAILLNGGCRSDIKDNVQEGGTQISEVNIESEEDVVPTHTPEFPTAIAGEAVNEPRSFGADTTTSEPYAISITNNFQMFSFQDAQSTTPADVLRELTYTSGGFGGETGFPCANLESEYNDSSEEEINDALFFDSWEEEETYEWGDLARAVACNWDPGESVEMSLSITGNDPLFKRIVTATDYGALISSYDIPLYTPPGDYRLKFSGQSGVLEVPIKIVAPDGPKLYYLSKQLVLHNFFPNENIRLFAYKLHQESETVTQGILEVWSTYQVDANGNMVIELVEFQDDVAYIVIGENSGEVAVHSNPVFPITRTSVHIPSNSVETSNYSGINETETASQTYISFENTASQTFSMQNANRSSPEDVLRELSYTGNYGGGPSEWVTCNEQHQPLTMLYSYSSTGPLIKLGANEVLSTEWLGSPFIHSCGWQSEENIHVTLKAPDGQVVFEGNKTASINGGVIFMVGTSNIADYKFKINSQLGSYVLSFEGQAQKIEQIISVEIPGPRTYFLFGEETDQLILFNFQPNETVRLFAYQENNDAENNYEINVFTGGAGGNIVESLVAWQEFQVNQDGQLVLQLEKELRAYIFRAMGMNSGQANINRLYPSFFVEISNPYGLSVRRPLQEELQSLDSIWSLTSYQDLETPGTREYSITVSESDMWRWSFTWCAANRSLLEEILRPLSIQFLVNGEEVGYPQLYLYDDIPTNGWACRRWATILENWPANETTKLEIVYQLNNSIFDGSESFPPGEYRHVLLIETEP